MRDETTRASPPATVLTAWGVDEVEPLHGGQGDAYRAGDLVLKPVLEARRATWLADVLDGLRDTDGVRIIRPVRANTGAWIVGGWSGWGWLEGQNRRGAWEDVLRVSTQFHAATADVPWSANMEGSDRWSVADRVAWGELERPLPALMAPLLAARQPVDLPSQLVHGDLGGNVLFHDRLAPAVIDVSPYWRPVGYADAIVVADAVAYDGAGEELVERLLMRQGAQLLIRAVLFRVGAAPVDVADYARLVPWLTESARQ